MTRRVTTWAMASVAWGLWAALAASAPAQTAPRTSRTAAPRTAAAPRGSAAPRAGANPQTAAPRRAAAAPAAPDQAPQEPVASEPSWWPLPAAHAKYVDEILRFWEFNSGKIERYECQFTRWIYDPTVIPVDPQTGDTQAREISQGVIKYMAPDKALYKAEKVFAYAKPKAGETKASYDQLDVARFGEHWVCDGQSIFEFDHGQKILRQIGLPPEAQGAAISKGPLPFLFRAKQQEIQERFRIRVITPSTVKGEYWLEAWPRHREDAAQFKFIHIIIDEKDYLPKALILFSRTYTDRNPARETFAFEKRKVNFTLQDLNILKFWQRDFFEPDVPDGWKKVVERLAPADEVRR